MLVSIPMQFINETLYANSKYRNRILYPVSYRYLVILERIPYPIFLSYLLGRVNMIMKINLLCFF